MSVVVVAALDVHRLVPALLQDIVVPAAPVLAALVYLTAGAILC